MIVVRDAKQLGSALLARRKELGLTQEQLVEKSGLSRTFLYHLEKGASKTIDFAKLMILFEALSLNMQLEGIGNAISLDPKMQSSESKGDSRVHTVTSENAIQSVADGARESAEKIDADAQVVAVQTEDQTHDDYQYSEMYCRQIYAIVKLKGKERAATMFPIDAVEEAIRRNR